MPLLYGTDEKCWNPNKRRKLNLPTLPVYHTMAGQESETTETPVWETTGQGGVDEPTQNPQGRIQYPGEIVRTSSREELMECIKRGQRPTWVPNASFQALCEEEEALNNQRHLKKGTSSDRDQVIEKDGTEVDELGAFDMGRDPYQRPRSALHRGDFAEDEPMNSSWANHFDLPGLALSSLQARPAPTSPHLATLSTLPSRSSSDPRALTQLNTNLNSRQRAPSLGSSLSSSFVMRTPTSPLVHATSNQDDPFVDSQNRAISRDTRRRTMPPNSYHTFSLSPADTPAPPNFSRPFAPALQRETSLPLHTHQPRGSLTSFTYYPRSNPQTPSPRTRRPSLISDSLHRRKTSMVGSFEESIVRGRMSAPASRPFDFTAQIGVMGKGDCPANLKCPAHVTVPFSAVYYSYSSATISHSGIDDTPSPYVGTIDLRQKLKSVILASNQKSRLTKHNEHEGPDSKIHVGGAYRVPQTGQLQIIIKSPSKTAVKLFLVPYDLTGMPPGTKSFVRQRIFSTGPIIDSAIGSTSEQANKNDPLRDKHILRYLIHVKFCCPAKGRFYLYDNARVVFANRVPDGKEKLRSELQHPEPMFSTWKGVRAEDMVHATTRTPTPLSTSVFSFNRIQTFDRVENVPFPYVFDSPTNLHDEMAQTSYEKHAHRDANGASTFQETDLTRTKRSYQSFPDINPLMVSEPRHVSRDGAVSPVTGFDVTPARNSPLPTRTVNTGAASRSFSPNHEAGNSLLSQQLRQLQERLSLSAEPASSDHD